MQFAAVVQVALSTVVFAAILTQASSSAWRGGLVDVVRRFSYPRCYKPDLSVIYERLERERPLLDAFRRMKALEASQQRFGTHTRDGRLPFDKEEDVQTTASSRPVTIGKRLPLPLKFDFHQMRIVHSDDSWESALGQFVASFQLSSTTAQTAKLPTAKKAGRKRIRSKRIVGGTEVQLGSAPYLVSLLLKGNRSEVHHKCGGVLVSSRWVASAAHCFDTEGVGSSRRPEDWLAAVGLHDLLSSEPGANSTTAGQFHEVSHIVTHPARRKAASANDIALVRLASPPDGLAIDRNVMPACMTRPQQLPTNGQWAPGTKCIASGWGHSVYNDRSDSLLSTPQNVDLKIVPLDACRQSYAAVTHEFRRANISIDFDRTKLCAGHIGHGGKDACQFDSGGPLMCYHAAADAWLLAGMIHMGYKCGTKKYPGIYVNIAMYQQWIIDTMVEVEEHLLLKKLKEVQPRGQGRSKVRKTTITQKRVQFPQQNHSLQ